MIIFDVELTGTYDNDALNTVIVHHASFEQTSFPITHILNVAVGEIGWSHPWIELRCQQTGNSLALIQYEKNNNGYWQKTSIKGNIPEVNSRVDLYLLERQPNSLLDAVLKDLQE